MQGPSLQMSVLLKGARSKLWELETENLKESFGGGAAPGVEPQKTEARNEPPCLSSSQKNQNTQVFFRPLTTNSENSAALRTRWQIKFL